MIFFVLLSFQYHFLSGQRLVKGRDSDRLRSNSDSLTARVKNYGRTKINPRLRLLGDKEIILSRLFGYHEEMWNLLQKMLSVGGNTMSR